LGVPIANFISRAQRQIGAIYSTTRSVRRDVRRTIRIKYRFFTKPILLVPFGMMRMLLTKRLGDRIRSRGANGEEA
jgi:hypothetical protein